MFYISYIGVGTIGWTIYIQQLAANLVGGGIWEFVNHTDVSAFLERELMGLAVDGYQ